MNLDVLGNRAFSSESPWRFLMSLNTVILGLTGATIWSVWQLRIAGRNTQMTFAVVSRIPPVRALE